MERQDDNPQAARKCEYECNAAAIARASPDVPEAKQW